MPPAKAQNPIAHAANPLRTFFACVLAFIIPGAGHFYLRKYAHAAVFFGTITALAVCGWLMQGTMFSLLRQNSGEGFLQLMASIGNIFLGSYHLIFHFFGLATGEITAPTHEFGTTFIIIAALLNLLVILNAYDLSRGEQR